MSDNYSAGVSYTTGWGAPDSPTVTTVQSSGTADYQSGDTAVFTGETYANVEGQIYDVDDNQFAVLARAGGTANIANASVTAGYVDVDNYDSESNEYLDVRISGKATLNDSLTFVNNTNIDQEITLVYEVHGFFTGTTNKDGTLLNAEANVEFGDSDSSLAFVYQGNSSGGDANISHSADGTVNTVKNEDGTIDVTTTLDDLISPGSTTLSFYEEIAFPYDVVVQTTGEDSGDGGSLLGQASLNLPADVTYASSSGAFLTQSAETPLAPIEGPPCYVRGTLIETSVGAVPVEDLDARSHARTLCGQFRAIRWIGHRSYDGRFIAGNRNVLPVVIRAGALSDGVPSRDLQVSPKHAMFLDGMLIPAELLLNGRSIVQLEHVDSLTYYHIELDSHDILLAEDAPSESFIDHDSRLIFQNAAEHLLLQPMPAKMEDCAPRVEDGEVLARVRRRIAARAGLVADHSDDSAEDDRLDGRIDILDAYEISGWAFDKSRPNTPVRLELLDGKRVIGTTVANRFRPDLRQAGLGVGRCAYVFRFDAPLTDLGKISLRRASDGAQLQKPIASVLVA